MISDRDAELHAHLSALRPRALAELQRVLRAPTAYRTAVLAVLVARPAYTYLATLITAADTDEVVRLRLLRAIRDVGTSGSRSPTQDPRPRHS